MCQFDNKEGHLGKRKEDTMRKVKICLLSWKQIPYAIERKKLAKGSRNWVLDDDGIVAFLWVFAVSRK